MTRFWLGVGLLAALLLSGLLLGKGMEKLNGDISQQLSQAAEYALSEQWDAATELSSKAFSSWQKHRRFAASLTDHEPLEELDRMFRQLQIYEERRMTVEFAALCTLLSKQAEAMGEGHQLVWWNFW